MDDDKLIEDVKELMGQKDTMPEREYWESLGRYAPQLVAALVAARRNNLAEGRHEATEKE